jgi:hypothetical protein
MYSRSQSQSGESESGGEDQRNGLSRTVQYLSMAAFLTLRRYSMYARKHKNRKPKIVPGRK